MENNGKTPGILRALIVDDEEGARNIMDHLLQRIPGIEVIGKVASVDEAAALMTVAVPDLVFLDVQMPEKDGFQLVDYLQKYFVSTHVIFVTAHAEYAINAMKVAAFDYLLKPVMMSELQETILRYKATKYRDSVLAHNETFPDKGAAPVKLKFNTRTGYILISPEEIMYCEADVNYTSVYFGKNQREVITVNLGKVEEMLASYPFYRISRSVLINQHFLSSADRQKKQCVLAKGDERITLEMSPSHLRELEKYLDHLTP
jgi:two-component system, LytTR family, response regulator